ncbi:hypothetical protein FQA39_LY02191 [Lamprigera yunnana]|nr:hypothetical protein FQA39_LY02191 [Lamprigera yunnana]
MNSLYLVSVFLAALFFKLPVDAFMLRFDQMYITDLDISPCDADSLQPLSVENVTLQIEEDSLRISGAVIVREDLESPIKTSVIIKKKTWIGWIKIACMHNLGSCTFFDLCSFGYPIDEECPQELKRNNIPCRCPIKKGIYILPPSSFKYFDDRSILTGKYKGSVTVTHYSEILSCYNIYFTLKQC